MEIPQRVYSTPEHLELAMEFAQYQSDTDDIIKKQDELIDALTMENERLKALLSESLN